MTLKDFSVSVQSQWVGTIPFGGGHTRDTDPHMCGWKFRVQGACVLFGRKGRKGCFSVMQLPYNCVAVAVYEDHQPAEVSAWLAANRDTRGYMDCIHINVAIETTPGWALPFIQFIEANEIAEDDAAQDRAWDLLPK